MGRTTYTPTRPSFIGDHASIDRAAGGRQVDWALVGEQYRRTPGQVVQVAAAASLGATSITVVALARALPSGTVLDFGGDEFARTTAAAAAGATSITVAALPSALEGTESAIVAGVGPKFLPAGTVVGSALGSGKISPRVVTTNPAIGILESNATDDTLSPDAKSGYGVIVGGVIYENLLPEATGTPKVLASAVKTELQTAGVGTGFSFEQYADNRTA